MLTKEVAMRWPSVFWALFAATLALYLVIVLWSLPLITDEAGGLAPFDMRPMGYNLEEARAFVTALSDRGREFYLGTQHLLDWLYPALLGATFALGFSLLFRGALLLALIVLSVWVVGFDWLENLTVADLLRTDPTALDVGQVAGAARWSVLKSVATTLAWIALLAGGISALLRRRRAAV
jgi:hypothetical protein